MASLPIAKVDVKRDRDIDIFVFRNHCNLVLDSGRLNGNKSRIFQYGIKGTSFMAGDKEQAQGFGKVPFGLILRIPLGVNIEDGAGGNKPFFLLCDLCW